MTKVVLVVTFSLCFLSQGFAAEGNRVIKVGKNHPVSSIYEASQMVRDGDIVEVEAGDYRGDVAVWSKKAITIRGVNGRPRLIADGAAAERKAIWVVRGGDISVENIAFVGAKVPERNGAGIRLEKGRLNVRGCLFQLNENGILTSNDPQIELRIENSEFSENGWGDGNSHNLYVGAISKLFVQGSYFHRAKVGHLLKSRSRESYIYYNRFTDEYDGRASYELELPIGGLAVVVGNLIQQSALTENPVMISFGAESYKWPRNELYLSHNTIVNDRSRGGIFVAARAGSARVVAKNNVLVGKGTLDVQVPADIENNPALEWQNFVLPVRLDYRLKGHSKARATAINVDKYDVSLSPQREYVHPATSVLLSLPRKLSPGAFQAAVK